MKAALANIRLHFLGLSETEYHLSSSNNTKSSFSLLSVFHLHKDNEPLPLLQHALRSGWRANPPSGSGGGRGGREKSAVAPAVSQPGLPLNQPTNQTPIHPSHFVACLPLSLESSPNSPSSARDDKQLINFPDARRSKTQAGEEDCL